MCVATNGYYVCNWILRGLERPSVETVAPLHPVWGSPRGSHESFKELMALKLKLLGPKLSKYLISNKTVS